MKKILSSFLIYFTILTISGCFDSEPIRDNEAEGEFKPAVNLNIKSYLKDKNTLIITKGTAKPGDIVLINNYSLFIAKLVESVNGNVASVKDAKIEEVFTDLNIQKTFYLNEDDRVNMPSANSQIRSAIFSSIKVETDEKGMTFKLDDYPLYDKNGVSFKIGGQLFLERPKIDVDFQMSSNWVELKVHFGQSSKFHLNADTQRKTYVIDKDILLGTYAIPVSIAGITLSQISYSLILNIGIEGRLKISAHFDQAVSIDVGIGGNLKSVSPFYELTASDNNFYSYSIDGNGQIAVWFDIRPKIALQIMQYEVAVIYGEAGGSAKAQFKGNYISHHKNSETPSALLAIDAEAHANIKATTLINKGTGSQNDEEYVHNIFDWTKEFTSSGNLLK